MTQSRPACSFRVSEPQRIRPLAFACCLLLLVRPLQAEVGNGLAPEQRQEPAAEAEDREPPQPAALQNSLLRDFFRALYPRYQRDPPVSAFVESFVDSQIDQFLKQIEESLSDLRENYEMARKLRDRWLEERRSGNSEAARALRSTLRRLGDRSDDLADRLSTIFVGLERNKKLEFTRSADSEEEGYRREFEFLGRQLTEADRLVSDYFLRSTNTVELDDLGSENMLVRLDWAEFMAKDLAKKIR